MPLHVEMAHSITLFCALVIKRSVQNSREFTIFGTLQLGPHAQKRSLSVGIKGFASTGVPSGRPAAACRVATAVPLPFLCRCCREGPFIQRVVDEDLRSTGCVGQRHLHLPPDNSYQV